MNWTVISGTNRRNSKSLLFSKFICKKLKEKLNQDDQVFLLDLMELPTEVFNPDVYAKKPESFASIEKMVVEADALISVLPEYNGSAPGVFKFFIDLLPFPKSLQNIPTLFMGVSAGKFGAVRSVEHMQQVFQYRKALVYPESIFVPIVENNLTAEGAPKDDFTAKLFEQSLTGFIEFARRVKH